ncbi:Leucine-rich repeat protein kinase family protein [Rhynchospora pubera]|uniref:non-specific serine/threonine protein kinase n=1 Tax=Rhynchospora pubera TaxID=906938 RepID=A0AAV8DKC5_9POAL|nr:Leucine-rich repeat protein kinase family protein [Rhynchospora pubera]
MGLSKGSFRGSHWVFLLSILLRLIFAQGDTNSNDAAALNALASNWQNTPSNWVGFDPCGAKWVGISCNSKNRITSITLSSIGLKGTLSGGDIQNLSELEAIDLSYNPGLTGPLPASIGNLAQLLNLILVGCSFSGEIPAAIGKLSNLKFLSLNSNKFSGSIPATIGNLSQLYWLDLAGNQLTGTIPVSDATNPGLDLLIHTKHFHFGVNQLSGSIPSKLFSPNMTLIHVLFDNNNLNGSIPSTLGLVKTLEVLRLDRNTLTGPVPANLNNLTRLSEIHLANNHLNGTLPDLTGMDSLSFVDMSNNSFDSSTVPLWFSSLPSLTSLYLEYLNIGGVLPQTLFSGSPLQTLRLRNNHFNGTLDIGTDYSNQLQLIDLTNNDISAFTQIGGGYNKQLILIGNPVCNQGNTFPSYCKMTVSAPPSYNTSKKCITLPPTCPSGQTLSPNCQCAYPYSGTLFFRSPSFSDLSNNTYYTQLEQGLKDKFLQYQLPVDSISLQNVFVDAQNNLEMSLGVFPSNKTYFSQVDVTGIGFILSNQTYKPPPTFGPYYFLGQEYSVFIAPAPSAKKSNNLPIIIGASAGGVVLLVLICLSILIIRRKKTTRLEEKSQSFASWDPKSSGSIPQLKGARMFTFEEIKKCTNNFAEMNEVGGGGYGKVYRGTLGNGQLVAVKRAQEGSSQGSHEFRTEIELLQRVHHKNLVTLVGFCFEKGEQMLIYEYVPNGTLKDSLSGKSGVHLDWRRRLRVALGAAKGIAYLHELADPPIVHRDIKSSNVLLDENLNAKVSDFGLSKSLGADGKGQITTQVKGTMGYLDPEYYMTQQLTDKSDVYSFGVLLLELITGKKPLERGRYIVREVKALLDPSNDLSNLKSLLDPSLDLTTSVGGFDQYINLALRCVDENSADRPTMSEVVNWLEKIMQQAGVNPSSASNSLSFVGSSGTPVRHPYQDDVSFEYSGDAAYPRIEPK